MTSIYVFQWLYSSISWLIYANFMGSKLETAVPSMMVKASLPAEQWRLALAVLQARLGS